MAKHCETFDHTADVGLSATADSAGELFEALAEGLADYLCPRQTVTAAQRRRIDVAAEDIEALAVDFLSRVLAAFQADHFMIASVRVEGIDGRSVHAELAGETYDPVRHEIHTEVKAVTYYQLRIVRDGDAWVGRVVLDL